MSRFVAIKSQLDSIEKQFDGDQAELYRRMSEAASRVEQARAALVRGETTGIVTADRLLTEALQLLRWE